MNYSNDYFAQINFDKRKVVTDVELNSLFKYGFVVLKRSKKYWTSLGIDLKKVQGIVSNCFKNAGIKLSKGIYAGITGPSLETSAERRFLKESGADAVGMSTVMEVIAAKQAGFEIAGLSAITTRLMVGQSSNQIQLKKC